MFYVDEGHYNNLKQFMFRNSLGAMDFISLKGIGESQMKIARKTGFIDNAETIYNSEFQQINKVNSGWLNTSFKNAQTAKQYIIELINSKEAYEVKGSNILKISPSGKKITVSEDDEFLQSFTFEYKYVHTEINYSELLSSPVSISFPEYIHIAFDMSTGTDRTAGLNFNWTESTVLYINWGDGTEVQGFTNNIELNHTYHYFGKYYAQIWANDNNFENIEQFVADNCKMSEIIGLEKLTGLTYIDLRNNLLTGDIDLSNNTGLTTAWFMNNNLISIDLSGCSALTNIDTYDINSFKNNPNLEYLNLSGCLEFNHLYVCDTKMHTLDITGCTSLKYITIQVSNITELDITQCPELIGCTVAHNQIELLDFANAQNLVHIQADYNNLKELENLDNLDSIDEMTLTHNVN
ncbi:MAG: hypothetical protein GY756_23705 [bacterium]|nr:hypothetical protein [bacterium]